MINIIEGRIFFRTDDGALWVEEDEEHKIILSPIVARLLHLFIQEQGRVLTREEIMLLVWEDHGLEPSNNSLNQYVSQIRKIMHKFGLPDDVIRTVPREGFILSKHIKIVEQVTPLAHNIRSCHKGKHQTPVRISTNWLIFSVFVMVFLTVPFISRMLTDFMQMRSLTIIPNNIDKASNCPLYAVAMGGAALLKETQQLARHYLEENDITCGNNSVVYFFASNGALKKQGGRFFLSHCYQDGEKIISCMGYNYNTWL